MCPSVQSRFEWKSETLCQHKQRSRPPSHLVLILTLTRGHVVRTGWVRFTPSIIKVVSTFAISARQQRKSFWTIQECRTTADVLGHRHHVDCCKNHVENRTQYSVVCLYSKQCGRRNVSSKAIGEFERSPKPVGGQQNRHHAKLLSVLALIRKQGCVGGVLNYRRPASWFLFSNDLEIRKTCLWENIFQLDVPPSWSPACQPQIRKQPSLYIAADAVAC